MPKKKFSLEKLKKEIAKIRSQKPFTPSTKNKVETPKTVYNRKKKHRKGWEVDND